MRATSDFDRFCRLHFANEELGLALDLSRMDLDDSTFAELEPRLGRAVDALEALEAGALANPDEGRRVGHYWLRAPERAPEPELGQAIRDTVASLLTFAAAVHGGKIAPSQAPRFERVLVIGIGGSALGPQFVADALGGPSDRMKLHFFDNTDPDGMDRVLGEIGADLGRTLALVISKSGGTKETRNGMLEAAAAYARAGLDFGRHAVAVTGEGSELDAYACSRSFLARFPMWDWIGGRTSELSVVGLLPAALQGLDVPALLRGAAAMDEATRRRPLRENPAALLALAWWSACKGKGEKDMVLLPYKDRLCLFSRYLQQLVMESLGKRLDRQGREVCQGIAVYGNKGSTDQHAYVQQLRDGLDNFFVTFIEVLRDRAGTQPPLEVESGVVTGDYLQGFLQGTRAALSEAGRQSITLTIDELDARAVGGLIALYERAVGLYAELIDINAYHQPGVEAGKKAAQKVLELQGRVRSALRAAPGQAFTAAEVASRLGTGEVEAVYLVLRHLASNSHQGVVREGRASESPASVRFSSRV